ncbi:PadR family transcriptional regulator [Paenibacillus sp. S-38]|uniref:PadR family transcriptional regulator n=1 Tax=Paenibacillus sp. S-38 TaxID=3416710 RepID=UPI003CF6F30A
MARNQDPVVKEESLGHVVKVQQVIDFMVLSELQKGRRYASEMEQWIIKSLDGVGVNDGYLSARLKKLAENGHVKREWGDDNRYNRYYEITDSGMVYFRALLSDLPDRVKLAQKVYKLFDSYVGQFAQTKVT